MVTSLFRTQQKLPQMVAVSFSGILTTYCNVGMKERIFLDYCAVVAWSEIPLMRF